VAICNTSWVSVNHEIPDTFTLSLIKSKGKINIPKGQKYYMQCFKKITIIVPSALHLISGSGCAPHKFRWELPVQKFIPLTKNCQGQSQK
jgi:hypothetical protein